AKLDRLGRSTRDVLNLVHEAEKRGAGLRVLEPEFSTSNDAGRMLVTVLGMVGEPERRFILERQATGIAKAKANGVYRGRKPSIDRAAVRELRAQGLGHRKSRQSPVSAGPAYIASLHPRERLNSR